MKHLNQIIRLLRINTILAQHGLADIIVDLQLFAPYRFIIYLNPRNWFRRKNLNRGEAFRKTLEELGPIFVKFGQLLSTRPDILPQDLAAELSKLQDSVPPFQSEQALDMIQQAFGRSAFELFASFDTTPLASASIAQVHAATLTTGENVVVKILRPNIRQLITQDLSLLHTLAALADRYWPASKRFKPKEIVCEFERTLFDELDLQREAANASQLKRNFHQSPLLYVPTVYWDYVRENIFVMERIHGIPVTDTLALRAHGIDINALADRGVTIFFTQVFRDCFFHADMHPGNIFVSPHHPQNPQYICVDFGIVGTLNETDQRYLAENLLAFFNRDYRRLATLHVESGWVARTTRIDEFESAIRTVCEPLYEKPLKDISFALVVLQLFNVARRFDMTVQPQLVLLQKTLFSVEGLGRQLNPNLDLWATAKPFLEQWVRDQIGPIAFFRHLRDNIPFFVEQLPHMPRLFNDILMLSKEKSLSSQDTHPIQAANNPTPYAFWRGLFLGLLASSLVFGGLMHWHLLTNLTRN